MLTGLNVGLSYLAGSVVAWGIIGPATLHTGVTFGVPKASNVSLLLHGFLPMLSFRTARRSEL